MRGRKVYWKQKKTLFTNLIVSAAIIFTASTAEAALSDSCTYPTTQDTFTERPFNYLVSVTDWNEVQCALDAIETQLNITGSFTFLQDAEGIIGISQLSDGALSSSTVNYVVTVAAGGTTFSYKLIGRDNIDETLLSIQTHSTDCSGLACVAGDDGELCWQDDTDALWVCEAGTWTVLTGGGGGGGVITALNGATVNELVTVGAVVTELDAEAVLTFDGTTFLVGTALGNHILNIASHDLVDGGLQLDGTLITSSAAELNLLDGLSSLDYFKTFDVNDTDAGFTWVTDDVQAVSVESTIKLVAGTGVTLSSDNSLKAIKIDSTTGVETSERIDIIEAASGSENADVDDLTFGVYHDISCSGASPDQNCTIVLDSQVYVEGDTVPMNALSNASELKLPSVGMWSPTSVVINLDNNDANELLLPVMTTNAAQTCDVNSLGRMILVSGAAIGDNKNQQIQVCEETSAGVYSWQLEGAGGHYVYNEATDLFSPVEGRSILKMTGDLVHCFNSGGDTTECHIDADMLRGVCEGDGVTVCDVATEATDCTAFSPTTCHVSTVPQLETVSGGHVKTDELRLEGNGAIVTIQPHGLNAVHTLILPADVGAAAVGQALQIDNISTGQLIWGNPTIDMTIISQVSGTATTDVNEFTFGVYHDVACADSGDADTHEECTIVLDSQVYVEGDTVPMNALSNAAELKLPTVGLWTQVDLVTDGAVMTSELDIGDNDGTQDLCLRFDDEEAVYSSLCVDSADDKTLRFREAQVYVEGATGQFGGALHVASTGGTSIGRLFGNAVTNNTELSAQVADKSILLRTSANVDMMDCDDNLNDACTMQYPRIVGRASPATCDGAFEGAMYYDTDDNWIEVCQGGTPEWEPLRTKYFTFRPEEAIAYGAPKLIAPDYDYPLSGATSGTVNLHNNFHATWVDAMTCKEILCNLKDNVQLTEDTGIEVQVCKNGVCDASLSCIMFRDTAPATSELGPENCAANPALCQVTNTGSITFAEGDTMELKIKTNPGNHGAITAIGGYVKCVYH